jgi:hypothetical protein
MDNYYPNNAVYGVDEFLKAAVPPAEAVVESRRGCGQLEVLTWRA